MEAAMNLKDDGQKEDTWVYGIKTDFDVQEIININIDKAADKFFKQLGLAKNTLYKARDVLLKEGKLLSKGKGIYKVVEDEFEEVE